jgi:hypothetical protein
MMQDGNTKKTFYINAADFTVNKQEITQTAESRMIQAYADNKVFTEAIMPTTNVTIKTFLKEIQINLEYNLITFNEELSL